MYSIGVVTKGNKKLENPADCTRRAFLKVVIVNIVIVNIKANIQANRLLKLQLYQNFFDYYLWSSLFCYKVVPSLEKELFFCEQ